MCDCINPEFFVNEIVKARKQHRCEECNRRIEIGMRYHSIRGKWDGKLESYKVCRWCESVRDLWDVRVFPECGPCYGDLYNFIKEVG